MTPQSDQSLPDENKPLQMGELAVLNGDGRLRTLLGSCAGLAIYCSTHPIGGLAHIVLPDSLGRETSRPGKFVDTAVPELIRQIVQLGGLRPGLCAKIAGGANMLNAKPEQAIGDKVISALKDCLNENRIPVVAEHCGDIKGAECSFGPAGGKPGLK